MRHKTCGRLLFQATWGMWALSFKSPAWSKLNVRGIELLMAVRTSRLGRVMMREISWCDLAWRYWDRKSGGGADGSSTNLSISTHRQNKRHPCRWTSEQNSSIILTALIPPFFCLISRESVTEDFFIISTQDTRCYCCRSEPGVFLASKSLHPL